MTTKGDDKLDGKIILKFLADVLYLKGVLCFEEYDGIMECCNTSDLDCIFERMMKEDFNNYKRGDIDWAKMMSEQ